MFCWLEYFFVCVNTLLVLLMPIAIILLHVLFEFVATFLNSYPSFSIISSIKSIYRKSGNFRCKNIFVVDGGYEN